MQFRPSGRWAFLYLFAFWAATSPAITISIGGCGGDMAAAAAVAKHAAPVVNIIVEGFGDVVNRFYKDELNALQTEIGKTNPFQVYFCDYSRPDESDVEKQMRLRRVEEARALGYIYLDKRLPDDQRMYASLKKQTNRVFLACPGTLFKPLTDYWLSDTTDTVVYAEKPLASSLDAALDMMEKLRYRDPRFRAIDSYAYKVSRPKDHALRDIEWLGGIASIEFIGTENRSGSDETSSTPREFKDRDGAIEREHRELILADGTAQDMLPHASASLRKYVSIRTVRPLDVWAFRYRGVDGDPKKETAVKRETFFEATFAATDITGQPITGRIAVGKGVRSRIAGPDAENNAKLMILTGKNGRTLRFDLRGSGAHSATAQYYEADGRLVEELKNESHPYRAAFRDAIVAGGMQDTEQMFSIEDGVAHRQLDMLFTRSVGRDQPIPIFDGGMGGAHYRLAPYREDLVANTPPISGPNAPPPPTLASLGLPADRDVLAVGIGVMGLGFATRFADVGDLKIVVSDPRPDAAQVLGESIQKGDWLLAGTLREAVARLKKPRKVMVLVTNERVWNIVADQLAGLLEPGDVVIDGGNSDWKKTQVQQAAFKKKGIYMVGMGVSGGKEGALKGSAMTAGGDPKGWAIVQPMLEAIAARVPGLKPGDPSTPSVGWVGPGGAGHFAKMAHNGAEYAELQVLAEVYGILRDVLKMSAPEIAGVFQGMLGTKANSFLLETAVKVLGRIDTRTGEPLVDKVLTEAKQNGTGQWTALNALELGASAPTLVQSVFDRNLSALGPDRARFSDVFDGPTSRVGWFAKRRFLRQLPDAIYAARMMIYAQAFQLIQSASKVHFNNEINMANLTNIWRTGSILKSPMLDAIHSYFLRDPSLTNLLDVPEVQAALNAGTGPLAFLLHQIAGPNGYPTPCLSSVQNTFLSYATPQLPMNLVMAIRSAFGNHPFWRNDDPPGAGPYTDEPWGAR